MFKSSSSIVTLTAAAVSFLLLCGCSSLQSWPESPLYETTTNDPNWVAPGSKEEPCRLLACMQQRRDRRD